MKKIQKRSWWLTFVTVALMAIVVAWPLSSALAAADKYPEKPVRFLIAFAPGGSTDATGRLIATKLSERLGKQFVPENKAGGGGTLAAQMVANAAPDGYTLLFHSSGIILNPLIAKQPYDPFKSFTPIAKIGNAVSVLDVHPSVPANSVKELIALAKKEPGKLVAAAAGAGSFGHLSTVLFREMAGIDYKITQFKGGGPAMVDVVGGHSHLIFVSIAQALPQIKAGQVKALGYAGKSRSKMLPDVPTISEAGVPGYESFIWWGLYAPAGTPQPIIDKLNNEIAAIMKTPEMVKILDSQGAEIDLLTGTDFTKFMESESAKWDQVIKRNKITNE